MVDKPVPSQFGSVDPAPAEIGDTVEKLTATLCDENERMFVRMRGLFGLRNIGGEAAIDGLVAGFSSESALLKHEIAYVLGQMQDSYAVPALIDRLADESEDAIVRHEAAEALGAIGDKRGKPVLMQYVNDPNIVVAQSCEVGLDLFDWVERSGF